MGVHDEGGSILIHGSDVRRVRVMQLQTGIFGHRELDESVAR